MRTPDWSSENSRIQLYCGDCLEIMPEMQDKSVDLVLTDPPYGIGESNEKNASRGNLARPTDYGSYTWDRNKVEPECIAQMIRTSKNQIIFGGNYYGSTLGDTSCYLVWNKDNTGDFADCELAWTSFNSAVRIIKWRWNGFLQEDMKHKETRYHPTQKPVPVFTWILANYSKDDMLVFDPFLGSGTTAIACIKTGRRCIGIEKEPKYFDLSVKRIKDELAQLNLF